MGPELLINSCGKIAAMGHGIVYLQRVLRKVGIHIQIIE